MKNWLERPRDRVIFYAVLGALTALLSLTMDGYLPALPLVARDFARPPSLIQWTLSANILGFGLGQLFYGPLSDRFGRKPVLLGGLSLFVLAGIACGLAESVEILIGFRFFQGFGAAVGAVIVRAMIRDIFDGRLAARAFATVVFIMNLAPILAPPASNLLAIWFGWRVIFLALALIGVVLLIVVGLKIPETQARERRRMIDMGSIARDVGTLLGSRVYGGFLLSAALASAGLFLFISAAPYIISDIYGAPEADIGLWYALTSVGFAAGTLFGARAVLRFGIVAMIRLGLACCLAAAAIMAGLDFAGADSLLSTIALMSLYLAGVGLILPNAFAGALDPFPQIAGTASALMGAAQMSIAAGLSTLQMAYFDGQMAIVVYGMGGVALVAATAFAWLVPSVRER